MSMKIFTVNMPTAYVNILKKITDKNSPCRMYPSVSEAVRQAVKKMLIQDLSLASNLLSDESIDMILNAEQILDKKITPEIPEEEEEMEAVQVGDEIFFGDNTKVKLISKISEVE